MNKGEFLLLAMILCPQELCLEKAMYMLNHKIPLAQKRKVSYDWIDSIVRDDIKHMQEAGLSQTEIASLYSMDRTRFAHLFPTYDRGW